MAEGEQVSPRQSGAEPALSGRLAIRRSGDHLARIAQLLRALEKDLFTVDPPADGGASAALALRRTRLQRLDLLIQELAGLSDILTGAAPYLSDRPDQRIDVLLDRPRLQTLRCALRGQEPQAAASETVIF